MVAIDPSSAPSVAGESVDSVSDASSSLATPRLIVGLGGTLRPNSSTERLIRATLRQAEVLGCRTLMFDGPSLDLPLYAPHVADRSERAHALVEALRACDGVILGSPGYHGGISGQVKNALDYVEDLSRDARPYFDGRAIGCVATGAGWQGAVNTLSALRDVVHALRGWPTPLGIAANSAEPLFTAEGEIASDSLANSVRMLARQVSDFAHSFTLSR